ncbi:MAG: hypothetical protein WD229_15210, partial [Pirellulales bacterium]
MAPVVHFALMAGAFALAVSSPARATPADPPWQRSPWFEEQSFTAALEPAGRIHVNAPLDNAGGPAQATRIIIYALPVGNTIEQTLGCRMAEGMDWHYDIQHVAAQVRLLRSLDSHVGESLRDSHSRPPRRTRPRERIVLICAEADGLSWPSFRASQPDANATIARMVGEWRQQFGAGDCKVMLTGHSGGGSFMFGVIEGNNEIPA